ncbi:MAG: acetyl-CoA carboxylase biotin carboxyl carrier protein [Actinobacteria bacterium]|nr:acetyl-CoA carboxylase biotin carboxyl carrier protein [Actinomycetota bacterium]
MALSPEDIRALISAFQSSDWDEMSLQYGDTRLDLTRNGHPPVGRQNAPVAAAPAAPVAAPVAASAPVAPAAPAAPSGPTSVAHPDGQKVTSPSLGLFWRSPQPGAPSFVEVGQQVDAEDTVCIVEVMKLMNHVKAGVSGKVVAILVDNGAMVEFGQTLVVVEPGA